MTNPGRKFYICERINDHPLDDPAPWKFQWLDEMRLGRLPLAAHAAQASPSTPTKTFFDAGAEGINEWVGAINRAQDNIQVASFAMTHRQVIDALLAAQTRGITIKLLLDAKIRATPAAAIVTRAGEVRWVGDADVHEMFGLRLHAKVLIVDGDCRCHSATCITSSVNPSYFSNRAIEDVVVFRDHGIVDVKSRQFDLLCSQFSSRH